MDQVKELVIDQTKECECGCGTRIPLVGRRGKPRRFVWGHNGGRTYAHAQTAILDALAAGAVTNQDIYEATGLGRGSVKTILGTLRDRGQIIRTGYGHWKIQG